MKNIAILGSTGSIGTQTLEIVRSQPDLRVVALAEEPFIVLSRGLDDLVDVDSLTAISVCGVMIPLK